MNSVIRGGAQIAVERESQLAERRLYKCDKYLLYIKCIGGGSRCRWEDVPTETARTRGTD